MEMTINPIFRDLLDLPSEQERKHLEAELLKDGKPRDKLIGWKDHNVLVDGHNRYELCRLHNLPFEVEWKEFEDDKAVRDWIIKNQLSRRNLSPDRAMYFLGILYNETKQDPAAKRIATEDRVSTAEKLGNEFGVTERTVRRAGDQAKGIDVVAEAKGVTAIRERLAAIKEKGAAFSKSELEVLGKEPNKEVAVKAATTLIQQKKSEAAKAPDKKTTVPPVKKETYQVVFAKPNFDRTGFNVAAEERPAMAENCMVYMAAQDEHLATAMKLIDKWGLEYEASVIFKCDGHEGPWTDIVHTFMLVASKGMMTGPKKATPSLPTVQKDITLDAQMLKLIESYHPKLKVLDMRAGK